MGHAVRAQQVSRIARRHDEGLTELELQQILDAQLIAAQANRKFTDDEVREMRGLRETTGYTYREIGDLFGVPKETAWRIVTGKTYAHVRSTQ